MRDDFRDYVLDQLNRLEDVACRKMFDAFGLYHEGRFFGIIHRSAPYFKTNEETRGEYAALGMKPFKPTEKQILKNYYEVPSEILEDREKLAEWAVRAARLSQRKR
ncbi:MAG TPA: TfoX/Sxy family protein [Candidatus Paceibacterota bacterium]